MKINALVFISFFALVIACSPNNVQSDTAIGKILDSAGFSGSFALLDNGTEQFTIHNLAAYKDSAEAPLNSFFLLPSLIAVEKGIFNNNPSTWIHLDSTAAFQNLMQKLGRPTILKVIDSLHYGKGVVSADMQHFWLDKSLTITPDEQLGLIKKLYFNQLYFQKRAQETIKKMLLKEDNANYKLSYIATSAVDHMNQNWVLGYVEENKHVYFFVLSTKSKASRQIVTNNNIQVLKSILLEQGFFKGRR